MNNCMKKRIKKKYIWALMMIAAMALTACAVKPEEDGPVAESTAESSVESEKSEEENGSDTVQDDFLESKADTDADMDGNTERKTGASDTVEIVQGDPVIGIVDRYENNIIVIRDADDQDIILYFTTENAQVIEGDTPIAVGDTVEITYTGVQGDEEHPGVAVKVVAGSMMYNTGGDVQ